MSPVKLVNARVLIVVLEPGHARLGQLAHNDASVGRERDRLRRMEAVERAVLERGEVGPLGERGVVYHHWRLLERYAVAGCPGADPDAAAKEGSAGAGDREGGDDGGRAGLQHGEEDDGRDGDRGSVGLHVGWGCFVVCREDMLR